MLNPKQKAFIEHYLRNGGNATQAAISAGYSEKTAYAQGSRLLSHVEISAALAKRAEKTVQKLEITTERILQERARLAFFDPRKLLDSSGRPKAIHELDDDTAAAIAGLKVQDKFERAPDGGEGAASTVLEYKLADKNASLTALEKIHGMYREAEQTEGALNIHIHF
jgi:phage terminase small subunit